MGPICSFGETEKLQKGNKEFTLQSRWDRFALSVRPKSYEREIESLQSHLGETESLISVRPKHYERETESLHCELGGTDRSSRLGRNVTKGNREFAIPSR